MAEILKINNLTKTYGKVKALDNLNLSIESGNIYGLLGPNGSGKTTTLGIILGILAKTSGDYEWFGGEYGDKHRMRIGSILETPNFYPYLNADDNLKIVAKIKDAEDVDYDEILESLESNLVFSEFATNNANDLYLFFSEQEELGTITNDIIEIKYLFHMISNT